MSAEEVCPVCRWPGQGGAACQRCDWERAEGFDPGAATAADGPDLKVRLADRQCDYDLRAVTRVVSSIWPIDQLLLGGLAAIVRGGPPPGRIEQAMADAERPAGTSAGMIFALARLVSRKTDAVAFVEIVPDAVSWQTLVVDELGVPVRPEGGSGSYQWTAILPRLPVDFCLRYLQMAGGVGVATSEREEADPAALIAAADKSIPPVVAGFTTAAAHAAVIERVGRASGDPDRTDTVSNSARGTSRSLDTVLVRRTHNWLLLDVAARLARAVKRPVTEIMAGPDAGTLADVIDAAAAQAPLRYAYDLILVEANTHTGMVRPRPHELFPAGAAVLPGLPPVATVDVTPVTGYTAEQLALPIVARRGPDADLRDVEALDEQRPLIAMAGLDASTGGPFQVRIELSRPGQAQLLAPPGFSPTDAGPGGWPGLIADLPKRLRPEPRLLSGGLDLVLLVELGAAKDKEDAVAARVQLTKGVVCEFRDVPEARIAVLGYRDRFGKYEAAETGVPGQEGKALVVGSTGGFSTSDDLRAMFEPADWWRAVPVGEDHAAPVEEALWLLADTWDTWRWRPDVRHVVLVAGRGPPHPAKAAKPGGIHPCRPGRSWREALKRLQAEQALQCFAVLDDDPAPGYAAGEWRALTASGRFRKAAGTTAQLLAQDCGLAPRSHAQLRLAALAASVPAAGQEGAP